MSLQLKFSFLLKKRNRISFILSNYHWWLLQKDRVTTERVGLMDHYGVEFWRADNVEVNGPSAVPVVDILFIAREKTHGPDVMRKIPAIAVKMRYLHARISLVIPSSRSLRHASNAIVGHASPWLTRFAAREFCRSTTRVLTF